MVAVTRTARWLPMLPLSTGARRPNVSKLAADAGLAGLVAAKLDDDWSPQQIAQWLRREHPGDASMWVSHESIYRDVYMALSS
jgi:IS30 family transposase